MPVGLPVNRLINVSVNLSPTQVPTENFDTLLIVGSSNVINTVQRIREYGDLTEVANDFGTTAPEYLGAELYFEQAPAPATLFIGRWAQVATSGELVCGPLTAAQQAIANWTSVTAGSFKLAVNGGSVTAVTGLNFSGDTNMNGVASTIQTGVQGLGGAFAAVTVTWNQPYNQFTFTSGTTGASSAISYLTTDTATGTDISGQLMGTAATAQYNVAGIAAETALACVEIMDNQTTQFYGLTFCSTSIVDADYLAIAAYIEGDSSNLHAFGLTTNEAAALTSNDSTSIGYQLSQLGYDRTFYQYSSTNPYAICSAFGRMLTINFTANNSIITMMYQLEPGVIPENLTSSQANALDANHYNYFATFNNTASIIVNGWMASGIFFDTLFGTDWLANNIQVGLFNLFYGSPSKVPQTNGGNNQLATTIAASCNAGVNNGLIAPGTWNAPGFGQIATGQYLPLGYYIFTPDISTQSESIRQTRVSVPIQVAIKGSGAIQKANVSINFNQ